MVIEIRKSYLQQSLDYHGRRLIKAIKDFRVGEKPAIPKCDIQIQIYVEDFGNQQMVIMA